MPTAQELKAVLAMEFVDLWRRKNEIRAKRKEALKLFDAELRQIDTDTMRKEEEMAIAGNRPAIRKLLNPRG